MLTLIKYSIIVCSLTVIFYTASLADEKDDLSKHLIYSTYQFGRYASVIDVGIQPIGLPIGVTAEFIKMDRILNVLKGREALDTLP